MASVPLQADSCEQQENRVREKKKPPAEQSWPTAVPQPRSPTANCIPSRGHRLASANHNVTEDSVFILGIHLYCFCFPWLTQCLAHGSCSMGRQLEEAIGPLTHHGCFHL